MTADDVVHRALTGGGIPLAEAHLTDRQRIALLLEGAALLSHLHAAGWRPAEDWSEPRLGPDGLRCGGRPGKDPVLPQERLGEMLRTLFGGVPAGRGQARKIARQLERSWRQRLTLESPDIAVERLLRAAPFLWREASASARQALVAEVQRRGRCRLRVAGPGVFRRRLLVRTVDREGLEELLASSRARELWLLPGDDPLQQARRAIADGVEHLEGELRNASQRRSLARVVAKAGRFEDAVALLHRIRGPEAALLRVRCQLRLGQLGAAGLGIRRLEDRSLSPRQELDLASVALRWAGQRGEPQRREQWMARLVSLERRLERRLERGLERRLERDLEPRLEEGAPGSSESLVLEVRLARARGAWDSGRREQVEALLRASEAAREDPRIAWRWHQTAALAAMQRHEAAAVVEHASRALSLARRQLSRFRAAGLWNDLGLGRAATGDLAGAERAFLHAQRLFAGCQGPKRTTLALANLAEIRLRRGRLKGVEAVLAATLESNRASGNQRGLAQDLELAARLELVRGQPRLALERLRQAAEAAAATGLEDWRSVERGALAARARGWLGQREAAARELESTGFRYGELELEEHASVAALAGRWEAALEAAEGSSWYGLWEAAFEGRRADAELLGTLDELGAYRSARLVLDLESVSPGTLPGSVRQRAAAALSAVGAVGFAERLRGGHSSPQPWRAVKSYLASDRRDVGAVAQLFTAAGYGEVAVSWRRGRGRLQGGRLFGGSGGSEVLRTETPYGVLEASAGEIDEVLETLLALAARDLPPPKAVVDSVGMVGESPDLLSALARLDRLATGELQILILGESGTGKELAARRVHALSPRREGPFLPVNCAALSETLVLSDLFGHRRGAFTGADQDRAGVFEAAQGGVVFLDEIGDLPPPAQGMLLRVLQEGEVRRLGESEARSVDVRVLTATHRDLSAMVAAGTFRQDLYYRLAGACVTLPPLRKREGDVVLLAEHLLIRQSAPSPPPRLSASAREALRRYSWPGNVRELENVLRRATALAAGGTLEEGHLELSPPPLTAAEDYHQQVKAFRRRLVLGALEATGGRQAEAARRLGITRQALSYLVKQLKLIPSHFST
ncbi:MAG: sigma 54-interacting transcriptional regulator [Acidobacteriota bacterium]